MGLFHFLIVLQGIVAAALVGIILIQRSEGGGLGTGGSPSGLMSARGAADFLTRTTSALATMFIIISVSLAFVAARQSGGTKVDESFKRNEAPPAIQTGPKANVEGQAPGSAAATPAGNASAEATAKTKTADGDVPLDR
jgi:preprotein translocase subunit SecG